MHRAIANSAPANVSLNRHSLLHGPLSAEGTIHYYPVIPHPGLLQGGVGCNRVFSDWRICCRPLSPSNIDGHSTPSWISTRFIYFILLQCPFLSWTITDLIGTTALESPILARGCDVETLFGTPNLEMQSRCDWTSAIRPCIAARLPKREMNAPAATHLLASSPVGRL